MLGLSHHRYWGSRRQTLAPYSQSNCLAHCGKCPRGGLQRLGSRDYFAQGGGVRSQSVAGAEVEGQIAEAKEGGHGRPGLQAAQEGHIPLQSGCHPHPLVWFDDLGKPTFCFSETFVGSCTTAIIRNYVNSQIIFRNRGNTHLNKIKKKRYDSKLITSWLFFFSSFF